MQTGILLVLLAAILALLLAPVQQRARRWMSHTPAGILMVAVLLAAVLAACAALARAWSLEFAAAALAYTLVPALLAFLGRNLPSPSWLDLLTIVVLWLPLEFPVAASLIPRRAHGFVHSAAYGAAILLALAIFLVYRRFDGMRYRLPRPRDLALACAGFLIAAPILVLAGLALGFIPPFHPPAMAPPRIAWTFLMILAATALPEEILFRSLIQNWITRRFGVSSRTIGVSAAIFGLSHLNNAPGTPPNWRYAIVATLAGFAFGQVFQRSSSVVSSAIVHALVNTVKKTFF